MLNFLLKYLGDLNYFLGIDVKHLPTDDMFLSQRKYVLELLDKASLSDAKLVISPVETICEMILSSFPLKVICLIIPL